MGFHPLMHARESCFVPLPPERVLERLREGMDAHRLSGTVGERGFELQYAVPSVRNSWRPIVTGTLLPMGGGTLLELKMRPNLFVLVFTALHAVPFLGLSWLIGVAAFSFEVGPAVRAVGEAVGATAIGADAVRRLAPTTDPTLPGAEAEPPTSLVLHTDGEEVQVAVPGPRVLLGLGAPRITEVTVSRAGLSVGEETLPWERYRRSLYVEEPWGVLVVEDTEGRTAFRVPADEVPEPHGAWLVAWLDAVGERFRAPPEEGAEQDRARASLLGLQARAGVRPERQ